MQATAFNWQYALRRSVFTIALAAFSQFAYADSEYAAAWGPSVGSQAPLLSAVDQDENRRDLASLTGSQGLLLIFNRSVDW